MPHNNSMQLPALRAAADPERSPTPMKQRDQMRYDVESIAGIERIAVVSLSASCVEAGK